MTPQPPASQAPSPSPASPLCVICKKGIPAGALKCTECDSYQDWRRHLQFSALALSLLVALVSVSGIVIPAIVKALQHPASNVQVKLISVQPIEIHTLPSYEVGKLRYVLPVLFLVTNSGQRPALLKECLVSMRGAGQSAELRPAKIELFKSTGQPATPVPLPLKLDPGTFSPVRVLVELAPSTDLPEDWNRSEVRKSSAIRNRVTMGGSIDLHLLNGLAVDEKVTVEMPSQPNAFVVPYDKVFEHWRRHSQPP